MSLFYNISDKKLLEIRKKIFLEKGIPALEKNNFQQAPFTTTWFGKNNLGDYTCELCRLSKESNLEFIITDISKGDRWIKVVLNIFELRPKLKSLDQLKDLEGLQFYLIPNNLTEMRLRTDDFKGMPLFNFVEHKIGYYYSEKGLQKRIEGLGELIMKDMTNIDYFVKRWHEMHKPLITNWNGVKIEAE